MQKVETIFINGAETDLYRVDGFQEDTYLISQCGKVFSVKRSNEPVELSQAASSYGPRVTLWTNNSRYRPLVRTLLDRTFGAVTGNKKITDNFLKWYLKENYRDKYSDEEIAALVIQDTKC